MPTCVTKPLEIYSDLYIGDYFADTLQFSTADHAAFRLPLLHLWLTEPTDGRPDFATIAGASASRWHTMEPILSPAWTVANSNIEKCKAALRAHDGKRLPPHEWNIVRKIVLQRDEHICQYCGSSKAYT